MSNGEGALDQYWAFLKENYRKTYSEVATDHMVFPRNTSELTAHNGFGIIADDDGHTIALWLNIDNGIVTQACFTAENCPTCTAAGSMVTELAMGKSIPQVRLVTAQGVLENLGGLPSQEQHCAKLATDTLQMALEDFLSTVA
jgi:nitrogen fixation protein NifU and related proteins